MAIYPPWANKSNSDLDLLKILTSLLGNQGGQDISRAFEPVGGNYADIPNPMVALGKRLQNVQAPPPAASTSVSNMPFANQQPGMTIPGQTPSMNLPSRYFSRMPAPQLNIPEMPNTPDAAVAQAPGVMQRIGNWLSPGQAEAASPIDEQMKALGLSDKSQNMGMLLPAMALMHMGAQLQAPRSQRAAMAAQMPSLLTSVMSKMTDDKNRRMLARIYMTNLLKGQKPEKYNIEQAIVSLRSAGAPEEQIQQLIKDKQSMGSEKFATKWGALEKAIRDGDMDTVKAIISVSNAMQSPKTPVTFVEPQPGRTYAPGTRAMPKPDFMAQFTGGGAGKPSVGYPKTLRNTRTGQVVVVNSPEEENRLMGQ